MQYSIKFIRNNRIKCVFFQMNNFFFRWDFFWSNELIQFEIKAFADTLHFTDANFFCITWPTHQWIAFLFPGIIRMKNKW